jgi:hypothetical protein
MNEITFTIGFSMLCVSLWGIVYGLTPDWRYKRRLQKLNRYVNKEIK